MSEGSLEAFVPHEFWYSISSTEPDAGLRESLITFHTSLKGRDITGAYEAQRVVLRVLQEKQERCLQSDCRSNSLQFSAVALHMACKVFSSTQTGEISPEYRRELAVYFGVIGAEQCLGREMSPPEFHSARMFPILGVLYGDSSIGATHPCALDFVERAPVSPSSPLPNTEQPIRHVKSKLRLPRAMIKDLKKGSMSWSRAPGGYWVNFGRHFHTATKEWDEFRQYIFSSPFANESPRMVIARTGSSYPDDSPALDETGLPPRGQFASMRIARSHFV
jgi:hypothetical protein